MKNPKIISAIVLVVLVVILFLQNRDPVQTRILFFTIEASRAASLGLTFAVGVVVGLLWRSAKKQA